MTFESRHDALLLHGLISLGGSFRGQEVIGPQSHCQQAIKLIIEPIQH